MVKFVICHGGYSDGKGFVVSDDASHITRPAESMEPELLSDANAVPINQTYLVETYRIDDYPNQDGCYIARVL